MTNEAAVRAALAETDALEQIEAVLRAIRQPAAQLALWATLRKAGPGGLMERTTHWEDVGTGFEHAVLLAAPQTPAASLIDGCIRKARERRLASEAAQAAPRDVWAEAAQRLKEGK